jgi:hypothetical protein
MGAYLEVWTSARREPVAREADRLTLGADAANDLVLAVDRTMSRLHAALQRYRAGWCARDQGTQASEAAPELARREREVLVVLCRTVLDGAAFTVAGR